MYDLPALVKDETLFRELRASVLDRQAVTRIRDAKIKVTPRCNLRCSFCQFWRTTARDELSAGALKTAIDDLASLDCRKIHFSGGEPTLREDLPELIAHAANRNIRTALTTNGTLITRERAHALLAAGLRSITVSLDGATPDLHDRLRGVKGAFKRTLRGLRCLQRAKRKLRSKVKIRVNTVLTRHNYQQYPDLLAMLGELGVTDVTPIPVGEGGKSRNRLLPWQLEEFNEAIVPAAAELRARYGFSRGPQQLNPFGREKSDLQYAASVEYARGYYADHLCYVPWLHTLVKWNGEVFLCCMARDKMPAVGTITQAPLRVLFCGEAYEAVRRSFRRERPAVCRRCYNFLSENQFLEGALRFGERESEALHQNMTAASRLPTERP
jgi:MoaA/NifB/PqqE/SkfB family radical SAM enzyme